MSRFEHLDEHSDPRVAAVFSRFEREGRVPIDLYRVLANAPHLLPRYSDLAAALRHDAVTPRALRELVILRVAHLTGSAYEWSHHRKLAEQAGVPRIKIRAVADAESRESLDDLEQAVMLAVDEIHGIGMSETTVESLRVHLAEDAIVELVMIASFYEAIARMIQALGVDVEPEYAPYLGLP